MNPTGLSLDPPPPPLPSSYTPDPQYVPAPHLTSDAFMSAENLIYYYKDFYASLKYIQAAPELVYERLVANFNTVIKAARERELRDVCNTAAGAYNSEADNQLKAELVQLKSEISAMELEKQQQAEIYKTENTTLQSSNNRLTTELEIVRAKILEVELEHQQQAEALENYRNKNITLQCSEDTLKVETEVLKSKILAVELERQKQLDMLQKCQDENEALQSSNCHLNTEVQTLKSEISAVKLELGTLQKYHNENKILQSSNKYLNLELETLKSKVSAAMRKVRTLRECQDENDALKSSNSRLNAELGGLRSKVSMLELELNTFQEYRDENRTLQSTNESLNRELGELKSKISAVELEHQQQVSTLTKCRSQNDSDDHSDDDREWLGFVTNDRDRVAKIAGGVGVDVTRMDKKARRRVERAALNFIPWNGQGEGSTFLGVYGRIRIEWPLRSENEPGNFFREMTDLERMQV